MKLLIPLLTIPFLWSCNSFKYKKGRSVASTEAHSAMQGSQNHDTKCLPREDWEQTLTRDGEDRSNLKDLKNGFYFILDPGPKSKWVIPTNTFYTGWVQLKTEDFPLNCRFKLKDGRTTDRAIEFVHPKKLFFKSWRSGAPNNPNSGTITFSAQQKVAGYKVDFECRTRRPYLSTINSISQLELLKALASAPDFIKLVCHPPNIKVDLLDQSEPETAVQ